MVVSVHGGAQATIDPFLYTITMTVHPKRKPEEALAALDREIQRVKEEKVTKEEIKRAIKQARALFAYGSENITNQAFWLGYAEMFARLQLVRDLSRSDCRLSPSRMFSVWRMNISNRRAVWSAPMFHSDKGRS